MVIIMMIKLRLSIIMSWEDSRAWLFGNYKSKIFVDDFFLWRNYLHCRSLSFWELFAWAECKGSSDFPAKKPSHHLSGENSEEKHDFWKNISTKSNIISFQILWQYRSEILDYRSYLWSISLSRNISICLNKKYYKKQ